MTQARDACPWFSSGGPIVPGMLLESPIGRLYRVLWEDPFSDDSYICALVQPVGLFPPQVRKKELLQSWWVASNDPATLGALLGAVRKAWKAPEAFLHPDESWWVVTDPEQGPLGEGSTEFAALCDAWPS